MGGGWWGYSPPPPPPPTFRPKSFAAQLIAYCHLEVSPPKVNLLPTPMFMLCMLGLEATVAISGAIGSIIIPPNCTRSYLRKPEITKIQEWGGDAPRPP